MDSNTIHNPWLYLSGFKLLRVGLVIHGRLFQDIYIFKWEPLTILTIHPLKLNNPIKNFKLI